MTSWEIDGETVEIVSDFFWGGAPKSLQMVMEARKLEDTYSLEKTLILGKIKDKRRGWQRMK